MTLLIVSCNLIFSKQVTIALIMASTPVKISKEQSSITMSHDDFDPPKWSRCNSFSSSSNDSAVFCSNRHLQESTFSLVTRKDASTINRNRNSSGSSVCSNLSYLSDKDSKKPDTIQVVGKVKEITRLAHPDINASAFELKHKTHLDLNASSSILPFRHNLRRKIRKKKCSCDCTATCTTLVMRRYKEIGTETVKEETVISRTKVQTFVKNTNLSYESTYLPNKLDRNKKRRSEVEKLYDSLHEIEWAKNFSPDNILRQMHARQAASCSIFGRSSKRGESRPKPSKRHKGSVEPETTSSEGLSDDEKLRNTPEISRSTRSSTRSKQQCKESEFSSKITKHNLNSGKRNNSLKAHVKDHSKITLIESPIEDLKFESSGLLNIKNNFKMQNSSIDCKLISKSTELTTHSKRKSNRKSFELTNRVTTLIPKNFQLNSASNELEVDNMEFTTEFSLSPTFFDITEESIRTIDACFRDVGAEVVISTCCENNSNDLPFLTSVKDNNETEKMLIRDDSPPVLEPCISYQIKKDHDSGGCNDCLLENTKISPIKEIFAKPFSNTSSTNSISSNNLAVTTSNNYQDLKDCDLYSSNSRFLFKEFDTNFANEALPNLDFNSSTVGTDVHLEYGNPIFESDKRHVTVNKVIETDFLNDKKEMDAKCDTNLADPSLTIDTAKRILNKYLNILRNKAERSNKEKTTPSFYVSKKEFMSPPKFQNSHLEINASKDVETNRLEEIQTSVLSPPEKNADKTVVNELLSDENIDFVEMHRSISRTLMKFETDSEYQDTDPHDIPDDKSVASSEDSSVEDANLFPISLKCFFEHVKVYRHPTYMQVALKLTHGNSSFFTIESLEEMTTLLKMCKSHISCHAFIINGFGDSFSMGLDLRPLLGENRMKLSSKIAVAVKNFIEEISGFNKPIVALVNGPAYGLGMTLLNHADSIIASEKSTFCLPQSSCGFFPEGGATLTLPRAIGATVAMDMMTRGRVLTAHEARDIGLITEVYKENSLPETIVSRVQLLAETAHAGVETTKTMLKMHFHPQLQTVLENEVKVLPQMWLSDSCQEALRASLMRKDYLY